MLLHLQHNQIKPVTLYSGINAAVVFALTLSRPFYAPYLTGLGFHPELVSWLFIAFPVGVILLAPTLGRLGDELGRRWVILLSLVAEIVSLSLFLWSPNVVIILIARFLASISIAATLMSLARVEDGIHEKKRGKKTGALFSLIAVGQTIAPLAGAMMVTAISIRAPFYTSIAILSLLSLFLWQSPDIQSRTRGKRAGIWQFVWIKEVRLFLQHKKLRGLALIGFVIHATPPILNTFLPLLIVDELGLGYKSLGIVTFAWGLSHVAQRWAGAVADRFGYVRGIRFGTLSSAVIIALLPFFSSTWSLALLVGFWGMCSGLWNVSCWALISDIGEREDTEGQLIATYYALAKFGTVLSFALGGFVIASVGLRPIFFFVALLILFGNLLALPYLFERKKHRI